MRDVSSVPLTTRFPLIQPTVEIAAVPSVDFSVVVAGGAVAAGVVAIIWWMRRKQSRIARELRESETARKKAETSLQASEARFRVLFDHSPVPIVEYDYREAKVLLDRLRAEGVTDLAAHAAKHPEAIEAALEKTRFFAINRAALELLGAGALSDPTAIAERAEMPALRGARRENLLALWRGEYDNRGELVFDLAGGRRRHVVHQWRVPIVDGEPGYQRAQTVLIDITEIRQAEQAVRESEGRYRQLFQHSPVAIAEIDSRQTFARMRELREQGVTDLAEWFASHPEDASRMIGHIPIIGLNAAALQLLAARSLEEVVANLGRIMTPEAMAMRRETLLAAWVGRNAVEGETRITALDGTSRTVYQRWWAPVENDRPVMERTQLAFVDLTQIKSAERELAAERERLSVTLRAMGEGVVTIDTAGAVQFMNEAAGELTGWPPAAAVGRPFADVCVLVEEKTGRPVVTPGTDTTQYLPPRTVLRPREGARRLVEGRCAPMHDLAGRGIGAVLVLRDVTSRSQLEAELVRASKLESIGVLAGGIAHDFNNLLAIVMGNLTLALLDEKTAASAGGWLRSAEQGVLRARELTQQLLTFAKGGEPVRTAVSLTEVLRDAAQFALHGTAVKCEFEMAANVRPADADKGQIGQVVQNLVINAVQAMPEGGVIRLSLRNDSLKAGQVPSLPAGDYVRIEITDSGRGIPPEHLAHIFEPFFTTKVQGSGLGLATVHSVVRKHRGYVAVESTVGRGTTFQIWLPAAKVEVAVPVNSANLFDKMHGRVLFMDDEELIRTMTKTVLERLGLEATLTSDGDEAVREYERALKNGEAFDLVVMDLTVPGAMGGAEAMREILKIDPKARGIVSSGYSSDPVMANYRAHGFLGMVPKPYRISDFARTLREVMAEAR